MALPQPRAPCGARPALGVRAVAPPTTPIAWGSERGLGLICYGPSGKPLRTGTYAPVPHPPLLGVSGRRAGRARRGLARGSMPRSVRPPAPRSRGRRLEGRSRLVLGGGHPTLLLHEPVSWLGSRGRVFAALTPPVAPRAPRPSPGRGPPPPGSGGGPGSGEKRGKGERAGPKLTPWPRPPWSCASFQLSTSHRQRRAQSLHSRRSLRP